MGLLTASTKAIRLRGGLHASTRPSLSPFLPHLGSDLHPSRMVFFHSPNKILACIIPFNPGPRVGLSKDPDKRILSVASFLSLASTPETGARGTL